MNPKELNFAYKVRHALNENVDNLPPSIAERLASARQIALSRKKKESGLRILLTQRTLAGEAGRLLDTRLPWLARIWFALPLLVLLLGALGLASIYRHEQQRFISEIAEIDAAVLTDELPLSAYVDHGFNAYLAKRGE
jgi:hypothetical protein